MTFASQSWTKRYEAMGDQAEAKWEEVCHEYVGLGPDGIPCSVRAGLSRPPFNPKSLPTSVRYTPDYVTPIGWVECQGVGRDQVLKVKVEKMMDMFARSRDFPVHLFVWDSQKKRHAMLTTDRLFQLIDGGKAPLGYFPEPKAYFGFRCDDIFETPPRAARKRNRRAATRCRRVPRVSLSWTPTQDFAGGDDAGTPLFRQGFPESELQALMECAPGGTPRRTKFAMQEHDTEIQAIVRQGMKVLDPVERVIIVAFFWEGDGAHSAETRLTELRDAGLYNGPVAHSHIQRLYAGAIIKLRESTTNPYEPKEKCP